MPFALTKNERIILAVLALTFSLGLIVLALI